MKKSSNVTTQRRKLVLRREAIAELTPLAFGQLNRVAGGLNSALGPPCHVTSEGVDAACGAVK